MEVYKMREGGRGYRMKGIVQNEGGREGVQNEGNCTE
jgi:hypothetical protein